MYPLRLHTCPIPKTKSSSKTPIYSDTPGINMDVLRSRCLAYAREQGWEIAEVCHVEKGVLPIVLSGSADAFLSGNVLGVPAIGLRGGFFHHTTSYSLPFAVRCADAISAIDPLTSEALSAATQSWAREHWQAQSFSGS